MVVTFQNQAGQTFYSQPAAEVMSVDVIPQRNYVGLNLAPFNCSSCSIPSSSCTPLATGWGFALPTDSLVATLSGCNASVSSMSISFVKTRWWKKRKKEGGIIRGEEGK